MAVNSLRVDSLRSSSTSKAQDQLIWEYDLDGIHYTGYKLGWYEFMPHFGYLYEMRAEKDGIRIGYHCDRFLNDDDAIWDFKETAWNYKWDILYRLDLAAHKAD